MIMIINYGLGNVNALLQTYKRLNIPAMLASDASHLVGATKLILPGVGAFDYAMQRLTESGMRESLNRLVLQQGIPVLGICVGMQMLAHSSDEGTLAGLGWIDGTVKKMNKLSVNFDHSLPHMGWNDVLPAKNNPLFSGLEHDARFYFLHSYYFECHNDENILAQSDYGQRFTCTAHNKNIFGVQFHPEKSHHYGVQLLKNFADL